MYLIGVAWASGIIGAFSHVVLSTQASMCKIKEVKARGADVTICGNTMKDRCETAKKLLVQHPSWEFVCPGSWKVSAGQGTIALEMLEQVESMLTYNTSLVAGEKLICPRGLECRSAVYMCLNLALV